MRAVLEFALSDRRPIVSTALDCGTPVWPISNELEFKRLQILSSTFGIGVREVKAVPGQVQATSSGTVVAFGTGTKDAARLYRHLTSRSYAEANSIADLTRLDNVEVVVAKAQALNERFLRVLEEISNTNRPGLIVGYTPQDLSLQVLLFSATARFALPRHNGRIDLFPELDTAVRSVAPCHWLIGRKVTEDDLEVFLNQACGVLNVFTHSDGICANFGPKVLCPSDAWLPDSVSSRIPTCVNTDYCHRLKVPLLEAFSRGERLRPESLSAYIALLNVCYGFMMQSSLFDGLFSYARQLVTGGRVGALVTARGLMFGNPSESLELANLVSSGIPLGQSLAEAADLPFYKSQRARLTLFGDPRIRVSPGVSTARLRASDPPRQSEGSEPDTFLTALLRQMMRGGELAPADFERLIEQVERPCLSKKTRAEVLQRLAAIGPLFCRQWLGFGTAPEAICFDDCCPVCSELCVTFLVKTNFRDMKSRYLLTCPRCGVTDDTSTRGRAVKLHLLPSLGVQLTGIATSEDWTGGIILESFDRRIRAWTPWPDQATEGRALALERLAGYTGYLSCSFFLLTGSKRLRVLSAPVDVTRWQQADMNVPEELLV